ncbi:CDP-glycerol glycerophosphotransferase [Hamadaea flava]|uniref:Glycosyltransferase family 2 protein n=1 Tax=Hamadaea flava TaxID=1742688 RepID=A0ABV8LWS1_9ACTN|nr:glycosyltransferase family 2 protein [Hamadaea flava]MCP2327384.1 CDP-glycerol glycerophosphotransferase [Hamadaea flava]
MPVHSDKLGWPEVLRRRQVVAFGIRLLARSSNVRSQQPGATLSVVVPVYRVEAYLEQCLDSVLSNPTSDIEVIAVDDASPDGCGAILDRYAEGDDRLRVLHLPVNRGLGQARNAGMDEARGRYIWFVDSDDWLPAGAVEAVLEKLRRSSPDLLIIDHAEVLPGGLLVRPRLADVLDDATAPLRLSQRPELLRLAQSACTKIVSADFVRSQRLRFLPGWYEDSYFSHLALIAAGEIDVLPEYAYCYRLQTPGSITNSLSARHFEVFDQYAQLFAAVDALPNVPDQVRAELFRVMLNHYLVILGNRWRLPPSERRRFFARIVHEYAARLPANGYARPEGADAMKHWLVRRDAFSIYESMRRANVFLARQATGRLDESPHPELMPDTRRRLEDGSSSIIRTAAPRQRLDDGPWSSPLAHTGPRVPAPDEPQRDQ